MPIAWLQHRSACALFLFIPSFPGLLLSPPAAEPTAMAVETAAPQTEAIAPAPEEPLVLPGVVIEEISKGSALEKAGLQVGDVILSWERLPNPPANPEGASGKIETPFDWMWLEIEQASRGVVRLRAERDGREITDTIESGFWSSQVQANLTGFLLQIYLKALEHVRSGASDLVLEKATEINRLLAKSAQDCTGNKVMMRLAEEASRKGDRATAYALLQAANSSPCQNPLAQSFTLESLGVIEEETERFDEAEKTYFNLLTLLRNDPGSQLRQALALARLARLNFLRGDLATSERYALESLMIRKREVPESALVTVNLTMLATIETIRGNIKSAQAYYQEVIPIQERLIPRSLTFAITLNNLGNLLKQQGDLAAAVKVHERALQLRRDLAPDSLPVADSLMNLGMLSSEQNEIKKAHAYLQEALSIQERLAPNSPDLAMTLSNLASLALHDDDFDTAEELETRALQIRQRLIPGSLDVVDSLTNIGLILERRGHLEKAEDLYRIALDIAQRIAPQGEKTAFLLVNLADLRSDSFSSDEVLKLSREALRILEKIGPDGLHFAQAMSNLGSVMRRMNRPEMAVMLYSRALQIRRNRVPGSMSVAQSLAQLALVVDQMGRSRQAKDLLKEALEISSRLCPSCLLVAVIENNLGIIAERDGDLRDALRHRNVALRIRSSVIPGTLLEAETKSAVGKLYWKLGSLKLAHELLRSAVESYEHQAINLGPSHENRSTFLARHSDLYKEYERFLLSIGEVEEAFGVVEAYRGRVFRALLSDRDLRLGEGQVREVEARGIRLERSLGQGMEDVSDPLRQVSSKERVQMEVDLEEVNEELRSLAPALAELRFPRPVPLGRLVGSLEAGVALVSYSVGQDTNAYVLKAGEGVRVSTLDCKEKELRDKIVRLLALTRQRRGGKALDMMRTEEYRKAAKDLFHLLIDPLVGDIGDAARLVIIVDGPLHLLPWGALIRRYEEGGESKEQYLAEWKAVDLVLSASVYSDLVKVRRLRAQNASNLPPVTEFVAFGDPEYPSRLLEEKPDQVIDSSVRAVARGGEFEWNRLLWSRKEVEGVAALFPRDRVRIFLSGEATEEQAKAVGKEARILHFATHAHVDNRFPLNSALVLTMPDGFPPDRDNGLLQVWEIFEKVRLDADLVVLSACETALGEEQGGEGLIGLTRAFQYAGARTVMASLWSVQDQATSELMIRFYKHLRAGMTKDEALRQAQIELIRGPIEVVDEKGAKTLLDASAPYFWAGFQLYGDWQ